MDHEEMNTTDADSAWPQLAADVTLARGAARSITLDTQRASTDGRIIDITAQLEQMTERLSSLETHVFEATSDAGASSELADQVASLGHALQATTGDFEALASRVAAAEEGVATTMMVSVDGFDSRLAIVEDARLAQTNELNQLTSYLEQAFTRITELAEVIEVERNSNASTRGELSDASHALSARLDQQIEDVRATVNDVNAQVASASTAIEVSRGEMIEALSASVEALDARVSATEDRVGQLDDVSASIQFLEARTASLESRTEDTQAIEAVQGTIDQLQERLEQYAHELTEASDRTEQERSAWAAQLEQAQRTVETTHAELTQLRSQIDEPDSGPLSDDLARQLEGLRSDVDRTATDIEAAAQVHSALQVELDAHRVAIDRVNDESHATRQLVHDVSERISNMGETSDLIGQRIDLVETASEGVGARIDESREIATSALVQIQEVQERQGGLDERLSTAATAIDAAHTRIDDAESTAQSAHARLDSTANELHGRLDTTANELHGRLDTTANELHGRLDENIEKMRSFSDRLDQADNQLNERFDSTVDHLESRIAESSNHASVGVEDELRIVTDTTSALSAKLDQTIDCMEGVVGATADVAGRVAASEETLADVDHRLEGHDERLANHDQRAASHDERLERNEQHIAAADESITALNEHVTNNSEHLLATEKNVAEQAQHVIANETRINEIHVRLTESEEATNHRLSESDRAIEEKLADIAHSTEAALEATHDLDGRIDHVSTEKVEALKDHLLGRVEEARAQLQLIVDQSQTHVAESQADLHRSVADRLDIVENSITARIAEIEATVRDADTSVRLTTMEATLAGADDKANEAYAFTESLRQLQTDIVQALQEELQSHESLIDAVNGRVHSLESAGQGFASAERVHMLEAKLVEALQTISQLTQLQRRNTTVESQLTDTLTATSHGLETTQATVVELRNELAAAQQRIGHLEHALSTAAAARGAQVAAQQVPAPTPAAGQATAPLGEAQPSVTPVDDDADTGWFTESYARKNQEPRAS